MVRSRASFTVTRVALTTVADSSIAHAPWREREKEARQNESEIQKKRRSKVRGNNNLKL